MNIKPVKFSVSFKLYMQFQHYQGFQQVKTLTLIFFQLQKTTQCFLSVFVKEAHPFHYFFHVTIKHFGLFYSFNMFAYLIKTVYKVRKTFLYN